MTYLFLIWLLLNPPPPEPIRVEIETVTHLDGSQRYEFVWPDSVYIPAAGTKRDPPWIVPEWDTRKEN